MLMRFFFCSVLLCFAVTLEVEKGKNVKSPERSNFRIGIRWTLFSRSCHFSADLFAFSRLLAWNWSSLAARDDDQESIARRMKSALIRVCVCLCLRGEKSAGSEGQCKEFLALTDKHLDFEASILVLKVLSLRQMFETKPTPTLHNFR